MDEITGKLVRIIGQKVPEQVVIESQFEDLSLDSLAMAEIISQIEAEFQISTDEHILEIYSVQQLVDYVNLRLDGAME